GRRRVRRGPQEGGGVSRRVALALAVLVAAGGAAPPGHAQHRMPEHGQHRMPEPAQGQHHTPEGWTFGLPKGEPAKGRQAFAKFECYKCHEVKGETFPAAQDRENVRPEPSMTVQELVDLVAYLKSLRPPGGASGHTQH